jgi:cytochrome P450
MSADEQLTTSPSYQEKLPLPPGPKGHFLLGVMRDFNADSLGFVTRCRSYGDVVRTRFLWVHAYFLYNPADIEAILITKARIFRKAQSLRSPFFARLVGNGLVTSEGEFWRRQRRLAQPAFHRQRISSYGEVMVRYAQRAIEKWEPDSQLDISKEMTRLTLEIVVKTLFNADVSSDADQVGAALSEVVKPFASQATLKWIADNRLPTPGHRRYFNAVSRLDQIVFRIIAERRRSKLDEGDLLSMLLQAQDEDGSQMTDAQLRDEVMTLFLAGHETTALALSWTWYLLANHPEVESKFHAELEQVLQGRAPTEDDMRKLPYTEMIAKETMRLYPPAYAVGREALEDTEIGGFRVPKGSQVFAFQWVTQRDERYFDNPDQFDPERWSPARSDSLPKYAYFPFGGGPRQCIGNYFAMMEIVLLLATIGQRFRFSLVPEHRVEVLPVLSLRPKNGIRVVVHQR